MASNQQTMNLYWVRTEDHDSDWFVFATSAREAQEFHEYAEGLRSPYGNARLIVASVTLRKFVNGPPPCHARFEDLDRIRLEAGTVAGRRRGEVNGEIFQDGILEAIIELSRKKPLMLVRGTAGPGWKQDLIE